MRRLKTVLVLLLVSILLLCLVGCGNDDGGKNDSERVVFPDANLEATIRDQIEKPSGNIFSADLAVVTDLYARGVSSIEGLQYCTNLSKIHLGSKTSGELTSGGGMNTPVQSNYVSDLSPLKKLTNLTEINLCWNEVSDISQLAQLINLTKLDLQRNQINDISALSNLTKLDELYLGWNNINDISPLIKNIGISEGDKVDLRYNPATIVEDISKLESRGVTVEYSQ